MYNYKPQVGDVFEESGVTMRINRIANGNIYYQLTVNGVIRRKHCTVEQFHVLHRDSRGWGYYG